MTYRKSMSEAIREVQESTIKPYVSMSMGGQYNVLDKDSKVVYSTKDKTLAYDYFKKNFDKLKEELQEAKIRADVVEISFNNLKQEVRKYNLSVKNNGDMGGGDFEAEFTGSESNLIKYFKDKMEFKGNSFSALKKEFGEQLEDLETYPSLHEVSDNLKLAVLKRKIKQYKDKVFKKTMSTIKSPLFAGYEEVEEGRMKDIFTAGEQGKSAEEIAKLMKLPLKTVKNILGEEVFEEQILEFTSDMITRLQKSYATMPKKISPEQATALSKHLDRLDLASLKQLTKAKIPFVTTLARNKVYKKTGKFEEVELEEKTYGETLVSKAKDLAKKFKDNMSKAVAEIEKLEIGLSKNSSVEQELRKYNEAIEEPKQDMPDDKEKVAKENSDKEIASLKDQIAMLKTKLENEKNKAVKPEPNPKTGEVPLTVGIAHKHFKDQKEKEDKKEVKENVSIKAYKNAVDPTKKGLMISKSGGMSGTIMIKDKKELKDLETKLAQAKRMYTMKEARVLVDLSVAYKNTNNVDEVQVVVDIPSHKINDEMYIEDEAIDRAEELLKQRKIGPRNVTRIDTMSTELLDVMKTSKPLSYYKATQLNQKEMKETAERDKRIQRAKDMIKFYDKQKKAALKGNNKDLAKKMLKNDSEDEPRQKKITPPLDTTGVVEMAKDSSAHAIGMSQAMKSTGDKPPLDKSTIKKGHKIAKAILNKEEKRMYIESMAGLKKKSEKSGMSYSILKKVYDRGMAAWTSGHRPGASQQQWAYARVNSFITKSSGTWGGADKDLAKQVKG